MVLEKRQEGLMTEGPILKQLLAFAMPLLLGNLFQQFYNLAEGNLVGVGSGAVSAIGRQHCINAIKLTMMLLALQGGDHLVNEVVDV